MAALTDYIYRCYYSRFVPKVNFSSYVDLSLNAYNNLSKYIEIDLDKEIIEIPCIYKYIITNHLANRSMYSSNTHDIVDKLYIPMFVNKYTVECKTSSTGIKNFFYNTDPYYNLVAQKIGDNIYLGGEGIIMYSDFTPLIMFTLVVKRVEARTDSAYKHEYDILYPCARINPIIYQRDDILAKFIRNKLITSIIEFGGDYSYRRMHIRNFKALYTYEDGIFDKPKIIIEDFSNFFETPTVPNTTFTSESVNEFLLNNINDVLK